MPVMICNAKKTLIKHLLEVRCLHQVENDLSAIAYLNNFE